MATSLHSRRCLFSIAGSDTHLLGVDHYLSVTHNTSPFEVLSCRTACEQLNVFGVTVANHKNFGCLMPLVSFLRFSFPLSISRLFIKSRPFIAAVVHPVPNRRFIHQESRLLSVVVMAIVSTVPNVRLSYVVYLFDACALIYQVWGRFGPMLIGVFLNMILYGVSTCIPSSFISI